MNIKRAILARSQYYALIILIVLIWVEIISSAQCPRPDNPKTHREEVRRNAIRYIEAANYKRWGTFVDAKDTLYMDGCLYVFDTVNLVYKIVATVTVHY